MQSTCGRHRSELDAKAGCDLFHAMDNLWSQARAVGLAWGPASEGREVFLRLEETMRGVPQPSADAEQAMFKAIGRRPF